MKKFHQPPLKYSVAQYKAAQKIMAHFMSAYAQNVNNGELLVSMCLL
jgi:hypothetical protein